MPFNNPAKVRVPDIEAVPPTSNMVSVAVPALIPNLAADDVNSNEPELEAFTIVNWPPTVKPPLVLNDPAVTLLVTVNDLEIFNDPANDDEPVPWPK